MSVKTKHYGFFNHEVFSTLFSKLSPELKDEVIKTPEKQEYKTVVSNNGKTSGGKNFKIEGTTWEDGSISISFYNKETQERFDLGKLFISKYQDNNQSQKSSGFETTSAPSKAVADDLPF